MFGRRIVYCVRLHHLNEIIFNSINRICQGRVSIKSILGLLLADRRVEPFLMRSCEFSNSFPLRKLLHNSLFIKSLENGQKLELLE